MITTMKNEVINGNKSAKVMIFGRPENCWVEDFSDDEGEITTIIRVGGYEIDDFCPSIQEYILKQILQI